jgi:hypothetical protein
MQNSFGKKRLTGVWLRCQPNLTEAFRVAGGYIGGSSKAKTRPTCRCRRPTKYELVVNLKTA